jgi:hypothetical protein
MTTAFLETTVLTDFLLKKDGSEILAEATLAKFDAIVVPQFSWKEFKRGPLSNFQWAHNKLAETKSFAQTLAALQRMSRSPRRYLTSTAIQALHSAVMGTIKGVPWRRLGEKYGKSTDTDELLADVLRLNLKKTIFNSWARRETLYGGQQQRLSCYPDENIKDSKPLLNIAPVDCPNDIECCLRIPLHSLRKELGAVRAGIPLADKRLETTRRRQFLRQIEKHSSTPMGKRQCRQFGDAYFVLFCPPGAVIITNNTRDIQPMADTLAISVAATKP